MRIKGHSRGILLGLFIVVGISAAAAQTADQAWLNHDRVHRIMMLPPTLRANSDDGVEGTEGGPALPGRENGAPGAIRTRDL